MAKKEIFKVSTPLGDEVALTRDRWREIVRFKHPALSGHEDEVQQCLQDPEFVRESAKDPKTHLYYRSSSKGHICTVVGGEDPQERFVVTAYFTKKPKKGTELWTR